MPNITLDLPDTLSRFLGASGNVERAALEAIALEAYREGQFRRLNYAVCSASVLVFTSRIIAPGGAT